MGDDRNITYQESDQTIYRASSIGHCIRQLVLSRKDMTPTLSTNHPYRIRSRE